MFAIAAISADLLKALECLMVSRSCLTSAVTMTLLTEADLIGRPAATGPHQPRAHRAMSPAISSWLPSTTAPTLAPGSVFRATRLRPRHLVASAHSVGEWANSRRDAPLQGHIRQTRHDLQGFPGRAHHDVRHLFARRFVVAILMISTSVVLTVVLRQLVGVATRPSPSR